MFHVHTYMHGWDRVSENKKVRETESLFIIIIIRGGGPIHCGGGLGKSGGDFLRGRKRLTVSGRIAEGLQTTPPLSRNGAAGSGA